VQRSHYACGMEIDIALPTCNNLVACFEKQSTLTDWTECLTRYVHTQMHTWLAGAWNCKVDLQDYATVRRRMVMVMMMMTLRRRRGGGRRRRIVIRVTMRLRRLQAPSH
jgi:hypothetical protein